METNVLYYFCNKNLSGAKRPLIKGEKMNDARSKQYIADIVYVLDATGNMSNHKHAVIEQMGLMYQSATKQVVEKSYDNADIRIKVIDFADFRSEGEEAIRLSDFFALPQQEMQACAYIDNIDCDCRGGDIAENALEALWWAMKSDWRPSANIHLIVLLTDSSPLDFQERDGCLGYDSAFYPQTTSDLQKAWDDPKQAGLALSQHNKRLVLFAPRGEISDHSWDSITQWNDVDFAEVEACNLLEEIQGKDICDKVLSAIGKRQ